MQQSEAFKILWTRLKTISSNFFHEGQSEHNLLWNQGSQVSHHRPSGSQISEGNEKIHDMGKLHSGIDFSAWMQLFEQKQHRRHMHLRSQLSSRISTLSILSQVCLAS